jgi:predicted aconitase
MKLSQEEQGMLDGEAGEALAAVFAQQYQVGRFFGADGFVPVTNAHFMGDPEVFGAMGLSFLRDLARAGLTTQIPTTRNPSCVDFEHADFLKQDQGLVEDETQVLALLRQLGVLTANTCIGYQTHFQPTKGEHVAWGDTGTVAYANSVLGARTNYESGPASLAAGLTGRTPAYGYHLDVHRRANVIVHQEAHLQDYADWGAVGAIVGERFRSYWNVPAFSMSNSAASSDNLKHLGASLASFGSMAMFHVVNTTPEAPSMDQAINGRAVLDEMVITDKTLDDYFESQHTDEDPDLVVFTAPQLSLFEMKKIASLLSGKKVSENVQLILTTNTAVLFVAEEQGIAQTIRDAGGTILKGTCWYIMDPAAQREQFGWKNVVTNSAKLVNIIKAHGYHPILQRTEDCVHAAITGKLK